MADLALSAVQTLFAALQCPQLQEYCDILGYKSQLKDLEKTVSTVKTVLIGAEIKEGDLSPEEEDYIQKLKDAVYDADDLFDEVLALAELSESKKGTKLTKKVRRFFSSVNPLSVAYNVSKQIKFVRKELEDIANNHNKFGLKFDSQPIRKRKPETYSSVNEFEVIGRDGDTKEVVDRLLASEEEVGFLSIVGGGGLGKTTLAQLVYKDDRIVKEFSNSRFWVCVSDHVKECFDVRVILSKIIELVAGMKLNDGSSMELVQSQFQEALRGKKCLVVLDDIWNENRCKWLELRDLLIRLGRGTRILVTTRSTETSTIIANGNNCTYNLGGLSPENSWHLFALMAFGSKQEHEIPTDFVDIGHKIVEKCCRVPLVLKVVGSLLFGQAKNKWDAYENKQVARIQKGDNDIMSILKFSYFSLESPLKSCFKYCAIFPKDFKLKREMLLRRWEAQGYIVPFEEGQSIQDAGEEYFSILLKRCFFQDVEKNDFGEVWSCKMHDFMHDLAGELTKNEIWRSNDISGKVGEKVRHIHYEGVESKRFSSESMIRPYIIHYGFQAVARVDNWKRLRVLQINDPQIEALPDTIGSLLHLRCLDLSSCVSLGALPNSVTQLLNLQTLDLEDCGNLKDLPKDLSKLGKLQHLNITNCKKLTQMPSRMDKLVNLITLTDFIVNEGNNSSGDRPAGELNELQFLTELRGCIDVHVRRFVNNSKKKELGGYLKKLKHIKAINLYFNDCDDPTTDHEALMEKLEPHSNLESISIETYKGTNFPNWGKAVADWATILPGLVKIKLMHCLGMEKLPLLSRLRHLETLVVRESHSSEYMEDPTTATASSTESIFFPSLVYLKLERLNNLKGWWTNHNWQPCFPRLSTLKIKDCPNFASFLCCPSLNYLYLWNCNQDMRITLVDNNKNSSNNNNNNNETQDSKLDFVSIDKWDYLRSMQMGGVTRIRVRDAKEMVSVSEGTEVLKSCCSLRKLEFWDCLKLKSISGGLEHLSLLESLHVYKAPELSLDEEEQPWRSLGHSLHSLWLRDIGQHESLPKGLQYLTNLEDLRIGGVAVTEVFTEVFKSCWLSLRELEFYGFDKLKSISGGLEHLSFLKSLSVDRAPDLRFDEDKPWRSLGHSLRSLNLIRIRNPVGLPTGWQYLTNLQQLYIDQWPNLESIPEWISSLSSLTYLAINDCPKLKSLPEAMSILTSLLRLEVWDSSQELKERCQQDPRGDDWHKIQHIPRISIISYSER